jgi:hypothetical protein
VEKVVKFINVHWALPCSSSDRNLSRPIGKQSERPRLFGSPPGMGFAHLYMDDSRNRIHAHMNGRPSLQRLRMYL